MKTYELEGLSLDYWVAQICGYEPVILWDGADNPRVAIQEFFSNGAFHSVPYWDFKPSSDWKFGGPIIETLLRGNFRIEYLGRYMEFEASNHDSEGCPISGKWSEKEITHTGDTMLEAAMRAFVASRLDLGLGDELPDAFQVALAMSSAQPAKKAASNAYKEFP